ncbi:MULTISPECIES: carbohydrate ABC transporter permease [Streptomyces]|uniref:carbohydrate ABC transporter permease n=1 Tax=Streptomyces TaxID=1883 RepID=UPI00343FC810
MANRLAAMAPRRRRSDAHGWWFLAPYLVLLLVFGLLPTGYAIYDSFVVDNAASAGSGLGTGNYQNVFADFRFLPALTHVGIFLLLWLPPMVIGVLFFALLLHDRVSRVTGAMRLVYFLPGAVTGSASVLLWYCMLQPSLSPFAPMLKAMGLTGDAEVFQSGNLTLIFAIMAFTTGVGQWIVIMYGALQNIPDEVLEAAALDGCGPVRRALLIKLPMVTKYVLYMVILSFAAGVQIFVEPQLIYQITRSAGSPWWSLNQFGYTLAFQSGDFGGAATVSVILLAISTLAALLLIFRTDFFSTEMDR